MLLEESDALCVVCQDVLRNPVHVVCQKACGLKLCKGCWDGYAVSQGGRPRCPMCKGLVFPDLTGADRVLCGVLGRFSRRCCYRDQGCEAPAALHAAMVAHEAECGFAPAVCRWCNKTLRAKDLEAHKAVCTSVPCDETAGKVGLRVSVGCDFTGSAERVRRHRAVCAHHRFGEHTKDLRARVRSHVADLVARREAERAADAWA